MATAAELKALAERNLRRYVAGDPELETEHIDDLLAQFSLADSSGLPPADVDWTPTYDLHGAAAEAFSWKMAQVSGDVMYTVAGESIHAEQALEHFEKMWRFHIGRSKPYSEKVRTVRAASSSIFDAYNAAV
jgi:hypothetical protein